MKYSSSILHRPDLSEWISSQLMESESFQDEKPIPNDPAIDYIRHIEIEVVAFSNLSASLIQKHGVGKIECFSFPDLATDSNIVRVILTVFRIKK